MFKLLRCALLLGIFSTSSQAMTIKEYLSYVSNNHPEILAIEATTGQYAADIAFADGAYDSRFEQTIFSRAAGYYDGLQATQRVSKPIEAYNAEVYSEYRVSQGEFPVYEEQYETLSGGEVSLGIKFSLLKGRDTDKDRTAMASTRLKFKKWEEEAKLAQSEFYYSALLAYLDWIEAVRYYKKIKQLVEVTTERQRGIKTRVAQGDIAKIALLEIETRLLERRSSLLSAERSVHANKENLRYFMHSNDAVNILNTSLTNGSTSIVWPVSFNSVAKASIVTNHPALNAKTYEMEDLKQNIRLAEVDLMPKLDIEAKLARDLGAGPRSSEETDARIGLYFSMPFNRTQAKAKRSKIQFEISTLAAKTEALRQSINANLQERLVNLSYAKQLNNMQKQQVMLSHKLFEQEQRQLELEASDFFRLNTREEDAFRADLKALTTQIKVYREELTILKLEAQLDQNFIQQTVFLY
jgi:outer membrane protein TolC